MKELKPEGGPQRLSITFSGEAMVWLEREAARRAISITEMVRRIVDETRGDFVVPRREGR